jgi:hypothetical protein
VFTTRVEPPVAIATLPDDAESQTAGEAVELQFAVVTALVHAIIPGTVVVTFALPITIDVAVLVPMLRVPAVAVSIPYAAGTWKRPRTLVSV